MTHTPGPCPWHRHVSDINGVVSVREKDGTVICQVWKPNDLTHARLIAAAPETAAERDRLKSANEHWHVRVTALKADVAVSLAERDRLMAINADLIAALEYVGAHCSTPDRAFLRTYCAAAIAKAQGDQ
ncbi:hypothetical protein LCGC14_1185400 [marine sediment metagenome]|uniref:Uncharacterized protein n=1 Tax=marine sediment metagenome TaxID=412755 RepID=A0A0F9LQQ5_9ZZZZ